MRGIIALLGVVLAAIAVAVLVFVTHGAGRVYAVHEIEQQVYRDPRHWLGKTVVVRGIVRPFPSVPCVGTVPCDEPPEPYTLDDTQGVAGTGAAHPELAARLFLDPNPRPAGDTLPALLHRLPLLGGLFPDGSVHYSTASTVRVRLLPPRSGPDCEDVCVHAILEGPVTQ